MTKHRASTERVSKAERAVIRAAMSMLSKSGFVFAPEGVIFPKAAIRLENALARLKEARKQARRKK